MGSFNVSAVSMMDRMCEECYCLFREPLLYSDCKLVPHLEFMLIVKKSSITKYCVLVDGVYLFHYELENSGKTVLLRDTLLHACGQN